MRYHAHKAPAASFVSDAHKELGAAIYDELVNFNYELGQLLRSRVTHLRLKDGGERSRATKLFRTFVPLHRDLTKLLHQSGGEKRFLPALEKLAQVVTGDVTRRLNYPTQSFEDTPEVGALPLSGATLSHLVFERFAATSPAWLPRVVSSHQDWSRQALHELKGTTIAEMALDYKAKARGLYTAKNARVAELLAKVHDALGAEDFDYLRKNIDMGVLHRFSR